MSAADVAARLPEIEVVRAWSRSLAVLDAIMSPDWQYRYFSFDPAWGGVDEMASMRNGSGDEYSIVFDKHGAFIRGFDHESSSSPWAQDPPGVVAGLLDAVPTVFQPQLSEPAFTMDGILAITVCIWRQRTDPRWHAGQVADPALSAEDDSAVWLFELLDGRPETYASFAEDYYERIVPVETVAQLLQRQPLTADIVTTLNPEADPGDALEEGWPDGLSDQAVKPFLDGSPTSCRLP